MTDSRKLRMSAEGDKPNGMPRHVKLEDSNNFFSGYDRKRHDLRGLSPLEQAIEIGGFENKNWTLSFIREIIRQYFFKSI